MTDADPRRGHWCCCGTRRPSGQRRGRDAERPLTARGHADAAAAGAWLARHGLLPDLVICSPARRTRQTWHGVAMGMTGSPPEGGPTGPRPTVRYEPGVYDAHARGAAGAGPDGRPGGRTVLLIAHNPGISLLSALLDPERRRPTRGCAPPSSRCTAGRPLGGAEQRRARRSRLGTPPAAEPPADCRRVAQRSRPGRAAQDGGAVGGGGSGGGGIIAVGCDSRFSSTIRVRARLRRSCQNQSVVSSTASPARMNTQPTARRSIHQTLARMREGQDRADRDEKNAATDAHVRCTPPCGGSGRSLSRSRDGYPPRHRHTRPGSPNTLHRRHGWTATAGEARQPRRPSRRRVGDPEPSDVPGTLRRPPRGGP